MYFTESLGEVQITLTDPADLPQDLAECPGQDGGQNKADQDHAQPVETGGDDGGRPAFAPDATSATQPVYTPI